MFAERVNRFIATAPCVEILPDKWAFYGTTYESVASGILASEAAHIYSGIPPTNEEMVCKD